MPKKEEELKIVVIVDRSLNEEKSKLLIAGFIGMYFCKST